MDFRQKQVCAQIKKQKRALLEGKNCISLNEILGSETCQNIITRCREFREGIYPPLKTLFVFIKQVLNPDKSCSNAVAEVVAEHIATDKKPISSNTGPYCKARQRLPESAVHDLVKEVGKSSLKKTSAVWKAFGRELKVVDGTSAIMSDTKSNQAIFPQQKAQKKGIGFPIARIVVVMSLTIGTVLDYAVGPFKGKGTGESALLRSIFSCIKSEDIVLGDRYYSSFFIIADLLRENADGIFKAHINRTYDFRKGKILGKKDHIADWKKPYKPDWMSDDTYEQYPDVIKVREFKVDGDIYVTTMLDDKKYHKIELAKVYKLRWHVEINLKYIKEIMKMDMLSCKTPEMVIKEIGIHFLGYNFIRIIIAEACIRYEAIPYRISFKSAIQLLNKFMPYFVNSQQNKTIYAELLKHIVTNKIGNRPGRLEPRKLKRRSKTYKLLNKPRIIEKMSLIKKFKKQVSKSAYA
jgi:hypothetical protein